MSNEDITLKDIHNDLKELIKWAKFSGSKEVKTALLDNVKTDEEKIVFSLSNGSNSSYEIARIMGANDTVRRKISDYWDKWEKLGLGEPIASQGRGSRFRCSFSLDEFGITVPELPKQKEQPATEPKQTEQQPVTEEEANG